MTRRRTNWVIVYALGAIGFAASSLGATSAFAESNAQLAAKTKWPECFCTDRQGKRRELGDIICLTVGGRSFMAKCVMAQNNPFWRDQERGCLSSNLRKQQTDFPTTVTALYQ